MIKNWLLLRLFSKPNTVSTLYLQGLSKQSNSVKDVQNFQNKEFLLDNTIFTAKKTFQDLLISKQTTPYSFEAEF